MLVRDIGHGPIVDIRRIGCSSYDSRTVRYLIALILVDDVRRVLVLMRDI